MMKHPVIFWIVFAIIWWPPLFIPLGDFHKPNQGGFELSFDVSLGFCYLEIYHHITEPMPLEIMAVPLGIAILHFGGTAFLATFITAIYRDLRASRRQKAEAAKLNVQSIQH